MKPTVLHVLEAVEGGTARYLADLVSYVDAAYHVVAMPAKRSVGVTDVESIERITEAAARVHFVDLRRSPATAANAIALRSLRRIVLSERPDVIHGHSTIGGLAARLVAGRRPVIYTPNALYPGRLAAVVERALGRRTAAIVAVSPSEADEIRRLRLVAPERVQVIRTGVPAATDEALFDLRDRIGAPQAAPVVGTAMRLVEQKDPHVFVAAMATVLGHRPRAHAVVFGDGPMRAEIERSAAATAASDRLHLLGHIPEARRLFAQLDVSVLASRFEGLPYALLEGMQRGVATVTTDAIGNRRVVRHEDTGLIVPVGSRADLAAAVARLLDDDALRTQLGAAARESVATEFAIGPMAGAYGELYERLAAESL